MSSLSFSNQSKDWWKSAVFYQIYPRSFYDSNNDGIGDLKGVIEKLDHLNDGNGGGLGIDAIWLSPFFTSPQADFGYDVSDYCDVDPIFGSIKDAAKKADVAIKPSIKIILSKTADSNIAPTIITISNPPKVDKIPVVSKISECFLMAF